MVSGKSAAKTANVEGDVERGWLAGLTGEERLPGESTEWLCGYDAAVQGRDIESAYQEAGWITDSEEEMYGHDWHDWKMVESSRMGPAQASAKKCPNCGKNTGENSERCAHCGAVQAEQPWKASSKTSGYVEGVDCPMSQEGFFIDGPVASTAQCPTCGQTVPVTPGPMAYDDDDEMRQVVYPLVHLLPGKTLSDRLSSKTASLTPRQAAFRNRVQAGLKQAGDLTDGMHPDDLFDSVEDSQSEFDRGAEAGRKWVAEHPGGEKPGYKDMYLPPGAFTNGFFSVVDWVGHEAKAQGSRHPFGEGKTAGYQVRRARDHGGEWVDAGDDQGAAETAMNGLYERSDASTLVLLRDPSGEVGVYEVVGPDFGMRPTLRGSYEKFYGQPFPVEAKIAMPNPVDLGVKVGDIFYSSWGYDQTNVNFYEVTGLTGASVKVREVAQRVVPPPDGKGHFTYEHVVPVPGQYIGGEMLKRLQDWGRSDGPRPAININSVQSAWLWDGKPQYQTAAGFGH